ncbi:hypothetical protein SAMN04488505_103374 [Chitinophaga rupis]|uniref:Uncharacterized protein n=1 Tax=Chitinophaga rupis TaxID=573321 RepID=A0A1H7VMU5_9BACT|nr:hypothetical protein SAMN04488505_103374 [Chitinophaga rupis]
MLRYILVLGIASLSVGACNASNGSAATADSTALAATAPPVTDTVATAADYPTLQTFWPSFQKAVKDHDNSKLITLTHFPLQGVSPFISNNADADTAKFIAALPDILGKAPRTQVLETPADSLLAIDPKEFGEQITGGNALLPIIDKDSKIYISYAQWAENENKETNQALIFAKIKGSYKLCAVAWRGTIVD